MLDPKILRDNPEHVAAQLKRRRFTFDVENFSQLETQRKEIQIATQDLQHQRKVLSKKIGQAKAKGESAEEAFKQVEEVASQLDSNEKSLIRFNS